MHKTFLFSLLVFIKTYLFVRNFLKLLMWFINKYIFEFAFIKNFRKYPHRFRAHELYQKSACFVC